MIKDFQTYINEGLFDRNQSEFAIIKTDRGIEQVYVPKTKEDLYKYIDLDIEQAKKDGTYPNVNLNNIDISELEDDALERLFSEDAYTINPDISDWDIKYIPKKFFDGNKQIKEFTIPDSVTIIGNDAFSDCRCLKSVTIPKSVTSIRDGAFYECNKLTKTNYTGDIAGWCGINFGNLDSNPTGYSHNLYINDVKVKDLVIPKSVTIIGSYAFYGCSGLTSVTIPNSVTSIGRWTFYACSGLTSVTIPNSVKNICSWAFYDCCGLKSVTIPNGVTSIGESTFYNCSGLTSVTIGNSVKRIGSSAFEWCSNLTSVTISKNCIISPNTFPKNCKIILIDD